MSFTSILQHIGHALSDIFKVGAQVATIAEPFVLTAFPSIAPLYASALQEAMQVEAIATAAGSTTGSGAQKFAVAFTAIEPTIKQFFATNNIPYDQAGAQKWLSAVVDTLNLLPAPAATPAAPAKTA